MIMMYRKPETQLWCTMISGLCPPASRPLLKFTNNQKHNDTRALPTILWGLTALTSATGHVPKFIFTLITLEFSAYPPLHEYIISM